MNDAAPLVQATGIQRRFGSVTALAGVDLHLAAGEVVGLLGPNGAGKSTLMKILAGQLPPSAGSIRIDGMDPMAEPLRCRQRIGYCPQDLPLYRDMSVRAYLDHIARLKGIPASARRNQVLQVMQRTDLLPVERRHIHKLSGGNRQRVGLAQALLGDSRILILDEPTAGLDPAQVANFRELIAELAREHSMLLSTHVLAEVEACCSRVVLIDQGRTRLAETVAELRQRTRLLSRLRLRLLHGDRLKDLHDRCAAADWCRDPLPDGDSLLVTVDDAQRPRAIACCQELGGLRECIEERLSLEHVFRELIAQPAEAAGA